MDGCAKFLVCVTLFVLVLVFILPPVIECALVAIVIFLWIAALAIGALD